MSATANRHKNVQSQLSWMEAKGIIHTYSPPSASEAKYGITMREHGDRLGLTLSEAEAWVSGAITMWAWYSNNSGGISAAMTPIGLVDADVLHSGPAPDHLGDCWRG